MLTAAVDSLSSMLRDTASHARAHAQVLCSSIYAILLEWSAHLNATPPPESSLRSDWSDKSDVLISPKGYKVVREWPLGDALDGPLVLICDLPVMKSVPPVSLGHVTVFH